MLTHCSSLTKLPSSIGNATNLKRLLLSGCSSLLELPFSIGNATNLKDLYLNYCSSLVELPPSIGNLQKLKDLQLRGCSKLEFLQSLEKLGLTDCSMLKSFPEISTNITILDLIGTAIEEVPPSIRSWPRLQLFDMSYFENLKEFPHALERITSLYLSNKEIQEVSLPQIPKSLFCLDAENCESLERLNCSFHDRWIHLNFGNCFKLNQETRDLIIQARVNAVLPGREVPTYFTHRATSGNPLTIKLNERPLPKSMRFKACILLDKGDDQSQRYTPGRLLPLRYRESRQFLYPAITEHLYTFEVKAEVTSSELVFEFKVANRDDWKVEACGLLQLLEGGGFQ